MVLISSGQLEESIGMVLGCKYLFLWIFAILGWFLYLPKIELMTPFLLHDPKLNFTFSGLKPQDPSTMLMKWSLKKSCTKLFLSVIIFSSCLNMISLFLRQSFFFRERLIAFQKFVLVIILSLVMLER